MKFTDTSITLNCTIAGQKPVDCEITLLGCEVPDEIVQQSALETSPRVKFQTAEKASGKIRKQVTMTWAEWLNPGKRARRVVVEVREPTKEEAIAKAMTDPKYLEYLRKIVQEAEAVEGEGENAEK